MLKLGTKLNKNFRIVSDSSLEGETNSKYKITCDWLECPFRGNRKQAFCDAGFSLIDVNTYCIDEDNYVRFKCILRYKDDLDFYVNNLLVNLTSK